MATLLSNSPGIALKRNGCKQMDAVGVTFKKFKYFTEVDSEGSLSGGAESIYSLQNRETASAHDTSDTEEHEFEMQSASEVTISEPSSGPEDCGIANFNKIIEESGSENSNIADLSESSSSDSVEFEYLSRKRCEKCHQYCEERFPLCLKCFREKKLYRPPRPKGRRRKTQSTGNPRPTLSDLGSQGSPDGLGESHADSDERRNSHLEGASTSHQSSQGSSQELKGSMCKCCFENPVDGAFIHKNSVHTLYCYKCSMKQWRLRGRCAFCNQKLSKVAKIFPVEECC